MKVLALPADGLVNWDKRSYLFAFNKQGDLRFLLIHNQILLVWSLSKLLGDFIFHSVKQAGGRSGGEVAFMFSATKTSTAGTEVTFAEKYCFLYWWTPPAAIAHQDIHFFCFESTTLK